MIEQDIRNSIAGWYFSTEEIASVLSNGHMINPSIDLSNPCNLNCPYCFIEEKNSSRKLRKANELSHEETLEVIRDLHSCGAKTINIVGAGEPTIDPYFEDTVKFIAYHGMKTVLFTNGIRFANHPALVEFLYDNDVSVVLKYNSASSEIQDLVAGRKGYSRKRNNALDLLLDAGFAAHEPTRLGFDTIVFRGNIEELAALHNWCRSNNIFPIAGEYIPTGRTEGGVFQGFKSLIGFTEQEQDRIMQLLQPINAEERSRLLHDIADIDRGYGIARMSDCAYYGGGICTQILGLYIDIEGNIWPCVARKQKWGNNLTSGVLGNVRKGDKPSQLWQISPYMKYLRSSFTGACPYKPSLIQISAETSSHEKEQEK